MQAGSFVFLCQLVKFNTQDTHFKGAGGSLDFRPSLALMGSGPPVWPCFPI